MRFPFFLPIILIFLGLLAYKRRQQTRRQMSANEDFLEKEREANSTRRKDISDLPYIRVALEKLPIAKYKDTELEQEESVLFALSEERCINLSDKTNTQLKLLYGPANLNELSKYDENFASLTKSLVQYAKRERELDHVEEARQILEYGLTIHSDISDNYTMLSEIYTEMGHPEKIQDILAFVPTQNEAIYHLIQQKLTAYQ
ncbi:MAG: hypothetical protein ACK5ML_11870 [Lachnospiraceae bacterium]